MTTNDLPDHLIELERSAWAAIQAGTLNVETAHAVHAAVTEFANENGAPRIEIETQLKKAVRHPKKTDV